ncbi:hypothetical protein GCM10011533_30230 [Streptosporangium jomthongense]|uniref:Nuclease domain-containing protein n=1 Tax=Marinobacter aromaticivorans TaxID=1494078 RepID=A0ABW2IZ37_9GAMM|nr:nuclease domain-containing protein [Marinobacter aromaticivorans]GGE75833.1 hypothetical protein GCM10011533_30230 [Streptosporangium jomthongense]
MLKKAIPIKSKHVRDAARGQSCTLQIVGACNGQWETTVLAHLPDESHGIARKADDLSACFACDACHSVIDGRAKWPGLERDYQDWYLRRAQIRTWRVLLDMGVLSIKGVA